MKMQVKALLRRRGPIRTAAEPVLALRRRFLRWKYHRYERFFDSAFAGVEAGSLVVGLPSHLGSFEIDFRSDILRRILANREYESELAALVKQHLDPHRDVVDVGANVGLFSVLFAKLVKVDRRVLAIEPASLPRAYLKRNLERNDCRERVLIYEGLASDQSGIHVLNVIPGLEEYASIGNIVHEAVAGRAHEELEVEGETIDALVQQFGLQPGFVKIDTEGAELRVLLGARDTLHDFRPVVLSELSDRLLAAQGNSAAEVVRMLQEVDYDVRDAATLDARFQYPFDGEILALPRS